MLIPIHVVLIISVYGMVQTVKQMVARLTIQILFVLLDQNVSGLAL